MISFTTANQKIERNSVATIKVNSHADKILTFVNTHYGQHSVADLSEHTGVSRKRCSVVATKLSDLGFIRKVEPGVYAQKWGYGRKSAEKLILDIFRDADSPFVPGSVFTSAAKQMGLSLKILYPARNKLGIYSDGDYWVYPSAGEEIAELEPDDDDNTTKPEGEGSGVWLIDAASDISATMRYATYATSLPPSWEVCDKAAVAVIDFLRLNPSLVAQIMEGIQITPEQEKEDEVQPVDNYEQSEEQPEDQLEQQSTETNVVDSNEISDWAEVFADVFNVGFDSGYAKGLEMATVMVMKSAENGKTLDYCADVLNNLKANSK